MAKLAGNTHLVSRAGKRLRSLREINELSEEEREDIYRRLLPLPLLEYLSISPATLCGADGARRVSFIAPRGLGLLRIEVKNDPGDRDDVFFLELADTPYRQMELSFCVISDPCASRFQVDVDHHGRDNWFASLGRNIPQEILAMRAGLFPNQVRRGLRMFSRFFPLFERFVDSLEIDMIVAEPLTYDNAIRYEKYGFDYLTGRLLMREIDREFRQGGRLQRRMDGSTPFRMPGGELTVRGRSWAIHDGILDEPWDEVKIYKTIGVHAGIDSFPGRLAEDR